MEYDKNTFCADGLRAFNPPGIASVLSAELGASSAIVIPPHVSLVVVSGQCGFNEDGSIPEDHREQIDVAFTNAEKALRAAGVHQGWKNVYQMTLYYTNLDEPLTNAVQDNKRKYLGDNRPTLTGVMVPSMYAGAVFEMTLYAYINKS